MWHALCGKVYFIDHKHKMRPRSLTSGANIVKKKLFLGNAWVTLPKDLNIIHFLSLSCLYFSACFFKSSKTSR